VLVVEDDEPNLQLLVGWLQRAGYAVRRATDGNAALSDLDRHPPDLVMLDAHLNGTDSVELCRRIKARPATRLTPVIMVTGMRARDRRIEGLDAGADDFLARPFDAGEVRARVRSLIRLKRFTDELESAEAVIMSLALTVEARDAYTEGHCQRLSRYATALGRAIGVPPEDLEALSRGGYLHDVGKIGIPDAILLKPGLLTPAEFEVIRQHPIIGERLCGDLRALSRVRPIVRHHHECLDGSGYPDGLKGDAIPLSAQIVSIVDAYDAITTTRPYRVASTPDRAFEELTRDATRGTRRGDLVSAFIALGEAGALNGAAGLQTGRSLAGSAVPRGRPV
jgi:putative two-component system response regulator